MTASQRTVFLGLIVTLLWIARPGPAQQPDDETAIRRYSEQAGQAMTEKNPAAAAEVLEKLARLTPDVPEVYANLGMAYYAEGQYEKAIGALKRVLQLGPAIPEAKLLLGICYAETGSFKEAVPILETSFRQPPNVETGREIGLQLMHSYAGLGEYGKASEIAEEMLDRFPTDPEILYRVSRLHADRSLQVMLHLVERAPNSGWKRMAFGEVHEAQKQYDLAIVEYRNALKTDPKLPTLHYHLGRAILLNAQDSGAARQEALEQFQQELAIAPHDANAEYEIGEIYRKQGRLEQAREHFLRAIQSDSTFEQAHVAAGRTIIDLKNPKEPLQHLLAATRLDPTDDIPHFFLAGVYRSLGDATQSKAEMDLFQKYHALNDPHPEGSRAMPGAVASPEGTRQILDSPTN